MTDLAASIPLEGQRQRVGAYLRALPIPYTSLAGTIIARHLERKSDLMGAGLVLWACEASGGDPVDAVATAAAVELFARSAGLRAELLGGHAEWGMGQSLNAGDALNALAYRALIAGSGDCARRLRASAIVTRAVVETIERRNGAITWAGMEAGAVLGGASERLARALRRAGRCLSAAGRRGADVSAAKAIAAVERAGLAAEHVASFEEAAHYLAGAAV